MKAMKHYRYEVKKIAKKTAETAGLLALLAARSVMRRFEKCPTPEEVDRACEEARIDEALKETFPASDPPSPSVGPTANIHEEHFKP